MKQSKKNLTMTEIFKGYSNYSEKEYKNIWENAIIVVDANILLNFYRYSEDTRNEIFKILEKQKSRLWIPYQVGKEFFYNKNNVMVNSYNEYDNLIKNIRKKFTESNEEINKKKNNQLNCKKEINKLIDETEKKIENILEKEKKEKTPKFEKNSIEESILKLFNNHIEAPYDDDEYKVIKEEGLKRFEDKTPPGYKDDNKEENGDYYIFYSMIKKAKNENKDIIFITDDVKEDWFNEINGEKHGGRPELLNEFYKKSGNLLIIYTSDGFVKSYNKNIEKQAPNEKVITELRNVRNKEYLFKLRNVDYEPSKNKELINILQHYKNNLINTPENLMKTNYFNRILFIISQLNIPKFNKNILQKEVFKIKNFLYETNDYHCAYDQLIDLIDHINITYKNKFQINKIDEIRNNYKTLLIALKSCNTNKAQEEIYNNIDKNIKDHLEFIMDNANKYNFDMFKRLQTLSNDVSNKSLENTVLINKIEEFINDENNIFTK